jgi:hypothetical protein
MFTLLSRAAYLLARSFNFQGRVKKIFYVLTDDKIGSGPRLKPGVLSQKPAPDDTASPMETDADTGSGSTSQPPPPQQPSLAAKLAAQANKRKATETPDSADSAARNKPKRK